MEKEIGGDYYILFANPLLRKHGETDSLIVHNYINICHIFHKRTEKQGRTNIKKKKNLTGLKHYITLPYIV